MPIGNFIKIAYLRKTAILSVCFSLCLSSTACSGNQADLAKSPGSSDIGITQEISTKTNIEVPKIINAQGKLLKDRFLTPEGFERTNTEKGSFAEYLQNLPLKQDGALVHYFDGRVKPADVYDAVIDMDIGNRDLQQCADAVMRLRSEYLYANKRYNEIAFHFANGFYAQYSKWMNGQRIVVEGNKAYWVNRAPKSNTYKDLRNYLDMVFAYAGTMSLIKELKPVECSSMSVGDVFIDSGHSIIVVDMAENKATGKKLFIVAQSYMPAQDTQILKNPDNSGISPWYELDFGQQLKTPQWTFTKNDLHRFQ